MNNIKNKKKSSYYIYLNKLIKKKNYRRIILINKIKIDGQNII